MEDGPHWVCAAGEREGSCVVLLTRRGASLAASPQPSMSGNARRGKLRDGTRSDLEQPTETSHLTTRVSPYNISKELEMDQGLQHQKPKIFRF